jgi:hypothetical protein
MPQCPPYFFEIVLTAVLVAPSYTQTHSRMKKPLLFACVLVAMNAGAQTNLAPNPSFESYTTCPTGINGGQGITTTHWSVLTGTPEYYHPCNTNYVGVPTNISGYQNPSHGTAYMGLYTYNNAGQADNKEYIVATVGNSEIGGLQVGMQYKVSLDVSLAEYSTTAGDGIGVLFYKNGLGANYDTSWMDWTIQRTPQIDYTKYGTITDTVNWVTLVDTFLADSPYTSVVIGGFKTRAQMDTINIKNKPGFFRTAYYFIDNFKIQPIIPASVNDVATVQAHVYPNPMKEHAILRFDNEGRRAYDLNLSNTLGQIVLRRTDIQGNEVKIEKAGLPAGIYYFTLSTGGTVAAKGKFVIE